MGRAAAIALPAAAEPVSAHTVSIRSRVVIMIVAHESARSGFEPYLRLTFGKQRSPRSMPYTNLRYQVAFDWRQLEIHAGRRHWQKEDTGTTRHLRHGGIAPTCLVVLGTQA